MKTHPMKRKKVVVIGLDGMGWHLCDALFNHGVMPTFKNLKESGLYGVLRSVIPPLTPPAWTTLATGVNPAKHGVFGFNFLTSKHESRLVSSRNVQYPRLHEMVTLKGLKSVCINQPLTYPLLPLTGTKIITDWLAPKMEYFPRNLASYQYPSYTPERMNFYNPQKLLYEQTRSRVEILSRMLLELEWDLFWIVFTEPDLLFHGNYERILAGDKTILYIFALLDRFIKRALEFADLLCIISDHGFQQFNLVIFPNCALSKLGLITTTEHGEEVDPGYFLDLTDRISVFSIPRWLYWLFTRDPFWRWAKSIFRRITSRDLKAKLPKVDQRNSLAFYHNNGIYIKDSANMLVPNIVYALKTIKGVSDVLFREEVYSGPFLEKAPQLLIECEDGVAIGGSKVIGECSIKRKVFTHHPDGIVLFAGKDVSSGTLSSPAEASDIVPSILRYMDLPLPINMDGRVISELPASEKTDYVYNYQNHWILTRKMLTAKQRLLPK